MWAPCPWSWRRALAPPPSSWNHGGGFQHTLSQKAHVETILCTPQCPQYFMKRKLDQDFLYQWDRIFFKKPTATAASWVMHATKSTQDQGQLTVKAPGATGEARRLLMDWKVAAGTPAMVFTITFPLTVPAGRGHEVGEQERTHLQSRHLAPETSYPRACLSL